jgi:chaperonin GroES
MSIQPLRDFVVVTKEEAPKQFAGSLIHRPDTVEDKLVRGKIVAVGSGRVAADGSVVPLEVHVGDVIVFNKNFATELTDAGQTALVLREDQILAVIR